MKFIHLLVILAASSLLMLSATQPVDATESPYFGEKCLTCGLSAPAAAAEDTGDYPVLDPLVLQNIDTDTRRSTGSVYGTSLPAGGHLVLGIGNGGQNLRKTPGLVHLGAGWTF